MGSFAFFNFEPKKKLDFQILLNLKGQAKLADFGEVTLLSVVEAQNENVPKRRSNAEQGLKGTPYFLPPEGESL